MATLPSNELLAELPEQGDWQRFGERIRELKFRLDVLGHNALFLADRGPEEKTLQG